MRASGFSPLSLWLLSKHKSGLIEVVLTIETGGEEEALPVFSFEEEAEAFLSLGALGTHWGIRETTPGELVSMLYGPCAGVGRVALDPLPELGGEAIVGLVSLSRERFCKNVKDRMKRGRWRVVRYSSTYEKTLPN